jgi:hypothetical protein
MRSPTYSEKNSENFPRLSLALRERAGVRESQTVSNWYLGKGFGIDTQ